MSDPCIKLRATSSKHALFLKVVGVFVFFVTLILVSNTNFQFTLPFVLLTLVSIVTFAIGVLKSLEPDFSLYLTPEGLRYCHKYGEWFVEWENIQRVAIVTQTYGLEQIALPYIGIRLKDLERLHSNISPRLASRLIHEQRDLYVASILNHKRVGELDALNLAPYKCANGYNVTGPIACWLHRSKELNRYIGYDIYLPNGAFDISPEAFVKLLRECKNASVNYQGASITELSVN